MPAQKTARAQQRRRVINRIIRSSSRTAVKKALRSLGEGDQEGAPPAVGQAVSALDRAASKGIIHRNNSSRRKSRLMKHLNRVAAE